jgi:hypothetical protein
MERGYIVAIADGLASDACGSAGAGQLPSARLLRQRLRENRGKPTCGCQTYPFHPKS